MNEANLLCIRFQFGVPLEDIFPSNDIHPQLQNLFTYTLWTIQHSKTPLRNILKNNEISLHEALNLKDRLVKGKTLSLQTSPSSFLWLLRHFLGLLPLPLFPHFTDGKFYQWQLLAIKTREKIDKKTLEDTISRWIHKLPKANVMLIYALISFFRKMSFINNLDWLDWKSIKALTLFFSSVLFFRPFRPGFVSKTDRMYYPLLCFMIVNWNYIKREKFKGFVEFEHNDLYLSQLSETSSENIEADEEKNFVERSIQTSSCLFVRQDDKTGINGVKNLNDVNSSESSNIKSDDDGTLHFQTALEDINDDIKTSTPKHQEEQIEEDIVVFEKKSSNSYINPSELKILNSNTEMKNIPDSPSYEELEHLTQDKQKKIKKSFNSHVIKSKFSKANRSLANVFTRMNEKIKSSHEILSKSSSKIERFKYDVLDENDYPKKVKSLDVKHAIKESPQIKYQKLNTL